MTDRGALEGGAGLADPVDGGEEVGGGEEDLNATL